MYEALYVIIPSWQTKKEKCRVHFPEDRTLKDAVKVKIGLYPILSRNAEALEKVQKLAMKFVKGLRHIPYEAALKQLRLFSLTYRLIRGDLISMFKITHGLLEFSMEFTFAHPNRKGLRGHAYKFRQQRCCTCRHQLAFTIRAVDFGTNCRLR